MARDIREQMKGYNQAIEDILDLWKHLDREPLLTAFVDTDLVEAEVAGNDIDISGQKNAAALMVAMYRSVKQWAQEKRKEYAQTLAISEIMQEEPEEECKEPTGDLAVDILRAVMSEFESVCEKDKE